METARSTHPDRNSGRGVFVSAASCGIRSRGFVDACAVRIRVPFVRRGLGPRLGEVRRRSDRVVGADSGVRVVCPAADRSDGAGWKRLAALVEGAPVRRRSVSLSPPGERADRRLARGGRPGRQGRGLSSVRYRSRCDSLPAVPANPFAGRSESTAVSPLRSPRRPPGEDGNPDGADRFSVAADSLSVCLESAVKIPRFCR